MSYHQRRSIRLKNYDYRSDGIYFITICTNCRDKIFGWLKNGKMILNKFGIIAQRELIRTAQIRTYVELDAFIIMPIALLNHNFLCKKNYCNSLFQTLLYRTL